MMSELLQFLYTVQVGRMGMLEKPTEGEKRLAHEHMAYMQRLTAEGVGIFGGAVRALRDSRHLGLFIFQAADEAAAQAIVDGDPAVKGRVMRACLYPFRVALWNGAGLRLEGRQQHFLYHIQAIRPGQVVRPTAWEMEMTRQHFFYLKEQTERGVFGVVGRTQNEDYSTFGMGVLRAEGLEEAWRIAAKDPGVVEPIMRLDVLPFGVAMVNEGWRGSG